MVVDVAVCATAAVLRKIRVEMHRRVKWCPRFVLVDARPKTVVVWLACCWVSGALTQGCLCVFRVACMWLLMLCGWLCVGVVCENWRVDASIDACACVPASPLFWVVWVCACVCGVFLFVFCVCFFRAYGGCLGMLSR